MHKEQHVLDLNNVHYVYFSETSRGRGWRKSRSDDPFRVRYMYFGSIKMYVCASRSYHLSLKVKHLLQAMRDV